MAHCSRQVSLLLACACLMTACAVGPNAVPPPLPSTASGAFVEAVERIFDNTAPDDRWWRLFQDPQLDRLVAESLLQNKDLLVATANIAQARGVLREVRAGRLPSTGLSASALYNQTTRAATPSSARRRDWVYDTGLDVSYEVDMFGRVSRAIEAARGDLAAVESERNAIRVVVAAETTRAYADACSSAEQLAVAVRTVGILTRSLELTTRQQEGGQATRLDAARARALRDQRAATVPVFEANRAVAFYALALLLGRTPADLPIDVRQCKAIPQIASPLPIGDGAALLRRRPDVAQAERELAAATARIGVATAALYPSISLGATAGFSSTRIGDLFTGGALSYVLGPMLSWSFPNQEAVRARIEQTDASARAALFRFDKVVLVALQETETALARYARELQRRDNLSLAQEQSALAARLSRNRFDAGADSFLALLDAERTFAEAEAELAASRAQIASYQIDLFRALGGGWELAPEPEGLSRVERSESVHSKPVSAGRTRSGATAISPGASS